MGAQAGGTPGQDDVGLAILVEEGAQHGGWAS
jgi:hypothetical protein